MNSDCAPGLSWTPVDHARRGRIAVHRARLTPTVWAIRVEGALRPGAAGVVARVARPILNDGANLIVDLRDVTVLGPRAVAMLAEIDRLAGALDRSLVLVARSDQQPVRQPLFDAGLLDVVRVARSVAEAFRAIRSADPAGRVGER